MVLNHEGKIVERVAVSEGHSLVWGGGPSPRPHLEPNPKISQKMTKKNYINQNIAKTVRATAVLTILEGSGFSSSTFFIISLMSLGPAVFKISKEDRVSYPEKNEKN